MNNGSTIVALSDRRRLPTSRRGAVPLRGNFAVVAVLCIAACVLPHRAAHAEPKHYELDPTHTRIVFAIDHLGFSKTLGTFSHPRGSLWFDADAAERGEWSTARLDVTIDIASLDLGDADFRTRMLKRDYFDLKRHADARFVSTRVEATGANTARVHGNFTLRGATQPLVLDVTLNKHGRNPLTFRTTAGFSATATLDRSAFGMTDNLRTVGDRVELRIEAEASRKRADSDRNDDNPSTPPATPRAAAPQEPA